VYGLDAPEPEDQADYRTLFDLVSSIANGYKFHELRSAQKGEVFRISVKEGETMDQNAWVCRLVHYIVQSQSLVSETEVLSYDDQSEQTEVFSVMHDVKATGRKRWYEAGVCVMRHLMTMVSLEVIHALGYPSTVPMTDVLLLLLTQTQYLKLIEKMKGITLPEGRKVYIPLYTQKAKYLPKEAFQIKTVQEQTMLRGIMERIVCRFIGISDHKLNIQKFFEQLAVLLVKAPKETFVANCAPLEQQLKKTELCRFDSLRFVLTMAECISSLSMTTVQRNSSLFPEDITSMEDGKVRCYYSGLRHYKKVKLEDATATIEKLASIAICHQQLQQLDLAGYELIKKGEEGPKRVLSGTKVSLEDLSKVILHSTSIRLE